MASLPRKDGMGFCAVGFFLPLKAVGDCGGGGGVGVLGSSGAFIIGKPSVAD
jgi:hypothetical protein